MKRENVWSTVISLGTILGLAFGLYFHFDKKFAKAEAIESIQHHVAQVDKRLDIKILEDRRDKLQERVWDLEKRFGETCSNCPLPTKEEFKKLKLDKELLDKKIDQAIK